MKGKVYTTAMHLAMVYSLETVGLSKTALSRVGGSGDDNAALKLLVVGVTSLDKVRDNNIGEKMFVGRFAEKVRKSRLKTIWACSEDSRRVHWQTYARDGTSRQKVKRRLRE